MLLDRRLNIVTGKGGVGKSTLSAAMALCAQAAGKRVLVCEVGAKERVAGLLGAPDSGPEVRQVDRSIWTVHVRPAEAMREYALMVLRFRAVYHAVFENRLVRYFLRAIPQLPEIVMLGKVWWHVVEEKDATGRPRWDMVILDAPATGHGLGMLGTPRAILDIVSEGPMLRDMRRMQEMLLDPAVTAVNIISLPEEMPVNESVELAQAVAQMGIPRGRLFLNGWFEPRFSTDERSMVAASEASALEPARRASAQFGERQDLSAFYEQRLVAEVPMPLTRVPHLPAQTFGRSSIEAIAKIVGSGA